MYYQIVAKMQRCETRNHTLHSVHEANETCVHDLRTLVLMLLIKTEQDMALRYIPGYKRVVFFPRICNVGIAKPQPDKQPV